MFGLFKKKSKKDKLIESYNKKKEQAFKLSRTNRKESDRLEKEANDILIELDKLKTYIREYILVRHNIVLENFDCESNFYFPQERSKPLTHVDPMNLTSSPDYVCLYGVNVGQDSCNVIIEYDDNRRKGKIRWMPLNNNNFVIFPANLKYHIDKNRSEQLNCILTISYTKRI